jgi:hypothetical protein
VAGRATAKVGHVATATTEGMNSAAAGGGALASSPASVHRQPSIAAKVLPLHLPCVKVPEP